MDRVKTIFLSYRRTNAPWALAIFQNLTQHGFDVFFDYSGVASGDFEQVILGNILARAHFLVLLTPTAVERCGEKSRRQFANYNEAIRLRPDYAKAFYNRGIARRQKGDAEGAKGDHDEAAGSG